MSRYSYDLHQAPKTDRVGQWQGSGIDAILIRLQSSKTDIWYSLHVAPNSFTLSGIQLTDMLTYLGFERSGCPYHHGAGYCREVSEGFDVQEFVVALGAAYRDVQEAEGRLSTCGYLLTQTEGWGYFSGSASRGRGRSSAFLGYGQGDGHTAPKSQLLKTAEDIYFDYVLTWIEGGQQKGWTTHSRPKHPPLSPDVQAALAFLGFQQFEACPEFDFEECYWRFVPFPSQQDFFAAERAHGMFEAHPANFARGIECLIEASSRLESFGMGFILPQTENRSEATKQEIVQRVLTSAPHNATDITKIVFDVAVSFAGPDRANAENLAKLVRDAGFEVFYDDFYPEQLWGKNGVDFFDDIYRKRSRHCVMFVSEEYRDRMWTTMERRSAQARAIQEKGGEYILPIQVDETDLPGLPPSTIHLSLKKFGIEKIAGMLIDKLRN